MPTTTNLGITIPTVGGSNNTWGDELNAALQSLDDLFVTGGSGTSVGLNVGSGKTLTLAGTGTVTGTLSASGGTLVLPQGASSAPTAEGSIGWDTDDNLLKIGDGSAPQTFTPSAAGTWTPTLTNVLNAPSLTATTCQYLRVGNTVTCSGSFDVDPTAGSSTITTVGVSLPIASDFTAASQCAGSGTEDLNNDVVRITGDTTNNRANFTWYPQNGGAQVVSFQFTYRVV